jgi:anaerobic selenocysteine-containing dehydrogenase
MDRRDFLKQSAAAFLATVAVASGAASAWAHHGWGWATGEEFMLTGTIKAVRLGNPHGELTLAVKGEDWVVEIGQPWRNERSGLTEKLLAAGTTVTAHGHRSANAAERLMKAERLVIAGKDYNLYPDRSS